MTDIATKTSTKSIESLAFQTRHAQSAANGPGADELLFPDTFNELRLTSTIRRTLINLAEQQLIESQS